VNFSPRAKILSEEKRMVNLPFGSLATLLFVFPNVRSAIAYSELFYYHALVFDLSGQMASK
jgi:hypothetical protein